MAITFRGATCNPADNGTLDDSGDPTAVTPVASMAAGDLCYLVAVTRSASASLSISNAGGQSWNALTLRQAGSTSQRTFWCRFNGIWSANPSVTDGGAGVQFQLFMAVWIPTSSSNTWAVDVAEAYQGFAAPSSPYDVTATGQTAVASSTVTAAAFTSFDNNGWTIQTAGWSNAGSAQYRNVDAVNFRDMSISVAYKIQTSSGATGNITNRQTSAGPDTGKWTIVTFKEQSSGVTVSAVGDGLIHDTEAGVTITGTSFGASHTGSADVIISPSNNIADASAVTQTQTSWSDTSVQFTADLSSFAYFTNLYVFVKNSGGSSNSSGFVIQREAWVSAAGTLKDLSGSAQASLTNVRWRLTAATLNGTLVSSATNGTSDGSGNFSTGSIVLADDTVLDPNAGDPGWLVAGVDGASLATSYAFIGKVDLNYT